ncbi:tetratricopeptide repeat protein [Streptomyces sp. NPDC051644]|uniref:tetratricopeptide repeat protein n=1 Tax=Streptomyces sp. NPDC051644 TaxID=3365666 RepID=UPI0037AFE29E
MSAAQGGFEQRALVVHGLVAAGATVSMAGDLVFGVLPRSWAVTGWTASALLVGGLTFAVQRRSAPAEGAGQSTRPCIDDLPSEPVLVGRTTLSRALCDALADVPQTRGFLNTPDPAHGQAAVVVVHGAAGTGKTTLALHAAHRVKASFPDARLHIDLRGDGGSPVSSAHALERCLRALGVSSSDIPRGTSDRAAMFRSLTGPMRVLMLLDNAHSAEQIGPLIPAGPGCAVVITSRRALSVGNIVRRSTVRVELPAEDEALAVLSFWAGRSRVDEDPRTALDIVHFCGRLPIALKIIGARLSTRPDLTLRRMCARLESERSRLRELSRDSDEHSLQACLLLTYQDLPEECRLHLCFLGMLPAGRLTDWHVAGAGMLTDPVRASDVVDQLLETCMMEVVGDDGDSPRYGLHDLIRVFASDRYSRLPPHRRDATERALIEAYCATALRLAASRAPELAAAEPGLRPATEADGLRAGEWFAGEADRLVWAHTRARELGLDREAALTAECASYFLDDLDATADGPNTLFSSSPSYGARTDAARGRARAALRLLAHDYTGARADVPAPTGDAHADARRDALLARIDQDQGDFRAALGRMTEAVSSFRALDDAWHLMLALESLGEILRAQGSPEEAESRQREALRLTERIGDIRSRARLRRTLGETLGYLRRFGEAADLIHCALTDYRRLGDRRWEAATLYTLGKNYRQLGRRTESLDCYDRALEIFDSIGDRLWVGRVLNARIRVLAGMGLMERAYAEAERALAVFDELGHTLWHAHTLRDLGWLHLRHGRPQDAVPPLESAAATSEQAGDAYAEAMARHLLGVAYRELGRTADARRELEAATAMYARGNYRWNEAACAHDLVLVLRAAGDGSGAEALASAACDAGPEFMEMTGRNGAVAVPDED